MTRTRTRATALVLAVLAALVALPGLGAPAHALSPQPTPPYEPDTTNEIGALRFYDAAGNQISSGNLADAPFAKYVQATTAGRPADTKATLFGYLPKLGQGATGWSGEQLSSSTVYSPLPGGLPASLAGSTLPFVTQTAADVNLQGLAVDFPHLVTDTVEYQGLYQLRLFTSGPGSPQGATYDAATVYVDTVAGTWQLAYPGPDITSTALVATPASPQYTGTSITLNATVTPATAAGSVTFYDGATAIGAAVPVVGGLASTSWSSLAIATHSLTAVFTPTDNLLYGPSTSTALAYDIQHAPLIDTTTNLAVNTGTGVALSPVQFTATVDTVPAGGTPAGTVTFTEGAVTIGTTAPGSGTFTLTTSGLTQGSHTITATFTATDPTSYNPSATTAPAFSLAAPAYAPAPANLQATIPAGTLVVSTPYTAVNPLDLGTLNLSADATYFTGSATLSQLSITDTRGGNLPWTVSGLASNLQNGGGAVINAQNIGLTNLVADPIAGNALTAASVVTSPNPAASAVASADSGSLGLGGGTPHTVLHADNGIGSIEFHGTLTVNAPTSSPAGTYTGTVTFTIG